MFYESGYCIGDTKNIIPYRTDQVKFFRSLDRGKLPADLLYYLRSIKRPVEFCDGKVIIQVIDYRAVDSKGDIANALKVYRLACSLSTYDELELLVSEKAARHLSHREKLEAKSRFLNITKDVITSPDPR